MEQNSNGGVQTKRTSIIAHSQRPDNTMAKRKINKWINYDLQNILLLPQEIHSMYKVTA